MERNIEQKFALAAQIERVRGIELVYPYDCPSTEQVKELGDKYRLEVSSSSNRSN